MAMIYISVGSNEQRTEKLRAARQALAQEYGALAVSTVYESEAVGFEGPPFYNLVIRAETEQTPAQVDQTLKAIEHANGRIRGCSKFSNRKLDLDLLLYDKLIQPTGPQLPRAEILQNAFVLWPLAELAPAEVHPITQQRYDDLWQGYKKSQILKPIHFIW